MGIAVFFATIGTAYHNRALAEVQAVLPNVASGDIDDALAGTSSAVFGTLPLEQRTAVVAAIIKAMRVAWAILIAAGACTFTTGLFLRVSRPFIQWMYILNSADRYI